VPLSDAHAPLPVGTRVVSRVTVVENGSLQHPPGAVGVVTFSPLDATHAYRIRYPGGVEVHLSRREFALLSDVKDDRVAAPLDALAERNLSDFVIYRCVVGSRAYGLDTDASDTDRRGIYLPPASLHWSLAGVPEQLEDPTRQECYWELQKFLVLALKANPNVLECLYTPLVEHADPLAEELLSIRDAFVSRLVYHTYNGYALSQFEKLQADLRSRGRIRPKHAMHLVRLLLSGVATLRDGVVRVRVEEERDRLLAVRDGRMEWPEIDAWRKDLHRRFDEALASSPLPERPDYRRANDFLVRARRCRAAEEPGAVGPS
jgi:predicted nucleotidyltransferase